MWCLTSAGMVASLCIIIWPLLHYITWTILNHNQGDICHQNEHDPFLLTKTAHVELLSFLDMWNLNSGSMWTSFALLALCWLHGPRILHMATWFTIEPQVLFHLFLLNNSWELKSFFYLQVFVVMWHQVASNVRWPFVDPISTKSCPQQKVFDGTKLIHFRGVM